MLNSFFKNIIILSTLKSKKKLKKLKNLKKKIIIIMEESIEKSNEKSKGNLKENPKKKKKLFLIFVSAVLGIAGIISFVILMEIMHNDELMTRVLVLGILILIIGAVLAQITPKIRK